MFDGMKSMMDTKRKIELSSPMELEQLFEHLKAAIPDEKFGAPELKKGLFGKSIVYPKTSRAIPRIKVKGSTVTISKEMDTSTSSVSVGGVSMTLDKDMRGTAGFGTAKDGSEYFIAVADAVTEALAGK